VTDVARSLAFYVAALMPFGWRELGNYDSTGGPAGVPDLYGLGNHLEIVHKSFNPRSR
jgi:hypothetical protein